GFAACCGRVGASSSARSRSIRTSCGSACSSAVPTRPPSRSTESSEGRSPIWRASGRRNPPIVRCVVTEGQRASKRAGQMAGSGQGRMPPSCGYRPAACDRRVASTYSDRKYYRPDELTQAAWRPHAMATGARGTELSDLHMIVLGRIAHRAIADVDDIAGWLGVPVVVAEALRADLRAAGLLTAARGH